MLESLTNDEWKHVICELNPSDIGTQGTIIQKLSESEWLSGPLWLTDHPDNWPLSLSANKRGS